TLHPVCVQIWIPSSLWLHYWTVALLHHNFFCGFLQKSILQMSW
ncbi:hypothetical protein LINGRAHAP2_LOCUS1997, partial [Linum grandiflorum]